MKKKQADDAVLVLSAEGITRIDKLLGRRKERRASLGKLMESVDIHVLDPSSGAALYRWKHLFWRKEATQEIEDLLELLGRLEDKDFLFVRLGFDVDDIEVLGGFTKNPFKVSVVREISISV